MTAQATDPAIYVVSARVGNYQDSFAEGVLVDQLWLR